MKNEEKIRNTFLSVDELTKNEDYFQNKDDIKDVFLNIATDQPKQVEKDIFINVDAKGYNSNPSEQKFYP